MDDLNNVMNSSSISSASGGEVIYGTNPSLSTSDDSRVISEKVKILASTIYKEFETMIEKNSEESVKNLMPLVVNVLECLDLAYLEKEEYSVDLEMLKEDNEQLITQYEREKQLRRAQDQKCLEIEDGFLEQIRGFESKIQSLISITRMLELKAKNASDHASRIEEREVAEKAEFDKLHDRYNTLLRTHIDHMERTKYLMGNDKFELMQSIPLPSQHLRNRIGMAASVDASSIRGVSDLISAHMSQSMTMDVNLAHHISNEADWQDEFGQNSGEMMQSSRDNDASSVQEPSVGSGITYTRAMDEISVSVLAEPTVVEKRIEYNSDKQEIEDTLEADLTGMGREVENLIKENTELLETKNALNIVKNDLIARVDELGSEHDILREEVRSLEMVRSKMAERIKDLELETRELKEKIEEKADDEENIPMAQRKRFTRLEMARVLMERNQYKEKLMELQEAVKWTELQRAKRLSSTNAKKTGGIWDFFSGLFSAETPARSTHRRRRSIGNGGNNEASPRRRQMKPKNFIDADATSEKRAARRREQYKVVRDHIKTEDRTRAHAYGWSVPSSVIEKGETIPVPVFCRPLADIESSLKIWCACALSLQGGRNRDGGFIVGHSAFYSKITATSEALPVMEESFQQINSEMASNSEAEEAEQSVWESSSLLWVCSSNQGQSTASIMDSNNPNSIIDAFPVCSAHILSVASMPGVRESDLSGGDNENQISLCRVGGYYEDLPPNFVEQGEFGTVRWVEFQKSQEADNDEEFPTYFSRDTKPSPHRSRDFSISDAAPIASTSSAGLNAISEIGYFKNRQRIPSHIQVDLQQYDSVSEEITASPTVWMGTQNEYIYVHSAVTNWKKCLHRMKMADAVLSILYYKGRVFAALANGTIAVFLRNQSGGWCTNGYYTITIGKATSSVRSLIIVSERLWASYRNCIAVINTGDLTVHKAFIAHPRRDSQVRHMQWIGDAVWISIRLDSTLRLYHAHSYTHLQDVDIEPYVASMLGTDRLDYSYLRTTALLVSCRTLWIGTGTGVIISVPLFLARAALKDSSDDGRGPGEVVRLYSNVENDETPFCSIPYCDMSKAQLSFHGHKDSVKFFLAVPGMDSDVEQIKDIRTRKMLIVSGGDGYIDFRMGETETSNSNPSNDTRPCDMSHLIVWQVDSKVQIVRND